MAYGLWLMAKDLKKIQDFNNFLYIKTIQATIMREKINLNHGWRGLVNPPAPPVAKTKAGM